MLLAELCALVRAFLPKMRVGAFLQPENLL